MDTNKVYFKLHSLCGATLHFEFGNNKESYIYCFDENLTDAVPNMVKMYNKLQNYEDYRFEASYDGKIAFTAKNLNKSLIQITISYSEGDIKADLCGRLSREECLTMFENLFDDILNNKDFPHQFPCFWDNNEEEYEKFSDVADKIFEELVAKKYCDNDLDICDIIDNVMCRELVSITPEGIEYYQKYKRMLETRTLPEGWAKRSDLDPIGDSIVNYIKQHTK